MAHGTARAARRGLTFLTLLGALAPASLAGGPTPGAAGGSDPAARLLAGYGRLPLTFERNDGQADARARFLSRGPGHALFLTAAGEAVLALERPAPRGEPGPGASRPGPEPRDRDVIRLRPVGSRRSPAVEATDLLPGRSHYFLGNDPSRWRTNVPNYGRVRYRDVYPGVDLVYYGNQRQLEYDLVFSPGTRPDSVRIAVEGARKLRLDRDGNLVVETGGGRLVQRPPLAYQEVDGERRPVAARYRLRGSNQVAFAVGSYDRTLPLVIDPVVLDYSTYLGGMDADSGTAVVVDASGSAYVTGHTYSPDFPLFVPFRVDPDGPLSDAFVTKLSPDGTTLVYSTYLGGVGEDYGTGVALGPFGNAFVTGTTASPDFPLVASYQPTLRGPSDVFLARLSSDGSFLAYSTYLGGSAEENGPHVAVDTGGTAVVTGGTASGDFPLLNPLFGDRPDTDAFVTRFDATGSLLVFSTYLGGSGSDHGLAVALDGAGAVYVAGVTTSPDFPSISPIQPYGGLADAFVTKLTPTGDALAHSTHLGGSGDDAAHGLAVDQPGSAVVVGDTTSTNFPVVSPLHLDPDGPVSDGFVSRLSVVGDLLLHSTYLGGVGPDSCTGVALDDGGVAHVTGFTMAADFPVAGPIQAHAGAEDAFVAGLTPSGDSLVYSTYLGGTGSDVAWGVAVDGSGGIHVVGETSSIDFPTVSAFQATLRGSADAFVTKLTNLGFADLGLGMIDAPDPVTLGSDLTYTLTVDNLGPSEAVAVAVTDTLPAGVAIVAMSPECKETVPGTVSCTSPSLPVGLQALFQITVRTTAAGTITGTASVTASNPDPLSSNNSAMADTLVVAVPGTDLGVYQTDSHDPATVGNDVTYVVTVAHNGTVDATLVEVSDTPPPGTTFVSATPSQGSCVGTSPVVCDLGTIAAGGSATVRLVVTPTAPGPISNEAAVTAFEPDPDPTNNSSTEPTLVVDASCAPLPSNLVAWWPADGTAADRTSHHHGALLGTTTFDSGKVGLGFRFDSDDDGITVPHATALDVNLPGFTADFWVMGVHNQPQSAFTVLEKSHGEIDNTGWLFQGDSTTGQMGFAVGAGGACTPGCTNFVGVNSLADLLDGRLHHVAGVWDGADVLLYVDGVLQGATPLATPFNNARPVNVGFWWAGGAPQRFFRGMLDEVEIHARALSPGEIASIHSAGVAGKCLMVDLALTKNDFPDPVSVWSNLTYEITVSNPDPQLAATNVVVDDMLPPELSLVSATPSQGTCGGTPPVVNCPLGTVPPGGSATVTIVATVTAPGTIHNTASVGSTEFDPFSSNNMAFAATDANPAGCTRYWDGPAVGDWEVSANWSQDTLPGPADDACIGAGNTVTLSSGQSINSLLNDGTLLMPAGGNLTLASPSYSAVTSLSGGSLQGPGDLDVVASFDWTAGTQAGTAATHVLPAAVMTIQGDAVKNLSERTLVNEGTVTWSGAGAIQASNGAAVQNEVGATWFVQSDAALTYGGGATPSFANAGWFRKTAGTGTSAVGIAVSNTGTVQVDTGVLSFSAGYTQTAGSTLLTGGGLGGTLDLQGGMMQGAGTVSGTVNNTGATIWPGNPLGVLSVTGDYLQGIGGTLQIDLGGSVVGTEYDRLAVTGTATLGGALTAQLFGGYDPPPSTSFQVLTATGGRSGVFSSVTLPPLTGGRVFATLYNPGDVTLAVNLASADVSVTQADSHDPATVGNDLAYLVTVANNGPDAAMAVTLTDDPPSAAAFVSATPSQGTCLGTGPVTCDLGALAPASSATVRVVVTPSAPGPIQNDATVTAAEPDPVPGNNSSTEPTIVVDALCTAPPADLVAWWPFQLDAADRTSLHDGMLQGSPSFNAGKVGMGLVLDTDDDSVTVPHSPELDVNAPGFTVDLWMRGIHNQPASQYLVVDKSHGEIDNTGWLLQGDSTTGVIGFALGAGGGCFPGCTNFVGVPSLHDVLDGRLHHVAGVWDGADVKLYVDGILQGSTPLATPYSNTRPVNVGFWWGGGAAQRFFRGQVDEVEIHSRALDPAEIQAIHAAGLAGKCLGVDLSIAKADSPDPIAVGSDLTYTLTVTNNDPLLAATNVVVDDTLPSQLTFVSATPSQGVCGGTPPAVLCSIGTIPPGGSATVTLVATVTVGGAIVNTAGVTASEPDPDPSNNLSTANTLAASADLAVTKLDSADPVQVGSTFDYVMTVVNNGPDTASDVTLTDTLPAGIGFVAVLASQGSCAGGPTVSCTLGPLGVGSTATVTVTVVANAVGAPVNTASASSIEADPDGSNNSSSQTTTVDPGPCDVWFDGEAGDGLWQTGANWSGNSLPGAGNDVCIGAAFTVDHASAAADSIHSLRNDGTLRMLAGSLGLAAASTTRDTVLEGGLLNGGPLVSTGLFVWRSGTIGGSGLATAVTVAPGSTLRMEGFGIKFLDSHPSTTLRNEGTIEVRDDGPFWGGRQAASAAPVLDNQGLIDLRGGASLAASGGEVPDLAIANSGVFRKSPGSGVSTLVDATTFTNQGLVEALADTVHFGKDFTQTAGSTLLAGGIVAASGGVTLVFQGGELTGNGNVTAAVSNTGAVVRPGGASPGEIGISGNYTQAAGGTLEIDLGGPVAVSQYDVLTVWSGASLDGTLNVLLFGGYDPPPGSEFQVLTAGSGRSGSFATVSVPPLPGRTMSTLYDPNDVRLSVQLASADVAVSQAESHDPATVGNDLVYTVSVSNYGPGLATAVILTDQPPAGALFVSATPSQGGCAGVGPVTCSLGDIAAGASATVRVVVTPPTAGSYLNDASVTAAEPDPMPTNNTSSETTTVLDATCTMVPPDLVAWWPAESDASDRTSHHPGTLLGSTAFSPAKVGMGFLLDSDDDGVAIVHAPGLDVTAPGFTVDLWMRGLHDQPDLIEYLVVDKSHSYVDFRGWALKGGSEGGELSFLVGDGLGYVGVTSSGDLLDGQFHHVAGVWDGADVKLYVDGVLEGSAPLSNPLDNTRPVNVGFWWGDGGPAQKFFRGQVDELEIHSRALDPFEIEAIYMAGLAGKCVMADLSITKTDDVDPGTVGQPLNYTVTVTNAGPVAATAVTVSDSLPSGLTFGSATPSQGTCNAVLPVITCDLGTLPPAGTATIAIATTPTAPGAITNLASVSALEPDPFVSDNMVGEGTSVDAVADVSVVKSDAPDPVLVGQPLTYILTVANAGPSPATLVSLLDVLPVDVTFVSATPSQGTCSGTSSVVCDLGTILAGGGATVTIVVTPTLAGLVTNSASVTATESDPDGTNNSASAPTQVNPAVDVSVTKADSPDPVLAGQGLTYTLTVANAGPSQATVVSLVDALPASVGFVSATPSQGTCSGTATVVCDLGAIDAAGTATVTIVVTPTVAGLLSNTASVTVAELDLDPANNSATATTLVDPAADLSVTKTDAPDPVVVGQPLTYTLTVANAGPSPATLVSLGDVLPTDVTFVSATPSQGTCSGTATVVCDLGTIDAAGTATVTIVVIPTVAGLLGNTASVTATEADLDSSNNTALADTTVSAAVDLSVTKADAPDPVLVGQPLTYTLTVANAGPSPATVVSLTDALPGTVTFVSATPSQGTCSGTATVVCDLGTVDAAGTATVTIVVTPTTAGPITNGASVTSAETDVDPANNSATATTLVDPAADLSVTKVDSPDPVFVGQPLTYTLTVTNAGPSPATLVSLGDVLPVDVTFVSATPSQGTCSGTATVVCDLGTIAAAGTASVTIVVLPTTAGLLANTASVSATEADLDSSNNTALAETTVNVAADLSLAKADSPDPVLVGEPLTYTLTVTNAGPSPATLVSLSDTLPAGVAFVSATPSQGTCSGTATVVCDLGTVAVAGAATVTIVVTPATAGSLTNLAIVTASVPDPDTANNSAVANTVVSPPSADLRLTKTDSPDPVTVGTNLTYTLTVQNLGPSAAMTTTVTDTLPAGVAFVSASPGCSEVSPGLVECSVPSVPAGGSVVLAVVVTPGATGTIVNSASVGSVTADPDPANNAASATTTVSPAAPGTADLGVVKTDSPDPAAAGYSLTYTIVASNGGPELATGVVVYDYLPAGVTFVSASPGCSASGRVVTCPVGALSPGGSVTIEVVVHPVEAPSSLVNSAIVDGYVTDPNPANDVASAETLVRAVADVSLAISDSPDPAPLGGRLTYYLGVSNSGPLAATSVTVALNLDPTLSVASLPAECTAAAGGVTCVVPFLAPGGAATLPVGVQPGALGTVTATGTVTAAEVDPAASNNTASTTTQVQPAVDLAVTGSDDPDPVVVGADLTYSLTVRNDGPSPATGVVLYDYLPSAVTFVSGPAGCAASDRTVTCALGSLAVGASTTVALVVRPSAAPAALTNCALAVADQPELDPSDDVSYETTMVSPAADVAVAKQATPTPAVVGALLRYTLTVSNLGPSPATSVRVTDFLPTNAILVALSAGCGTAPPNAVCQADYLAPGASATFELDVRPLSVGTLGNSARVELLELDPDPGNNTVAITTPVVAPPDLAVADVSVAEGNSGTSLASFLVTLSAPSSAEARVNWTTADGTATAGADYVAAAGTVVFAPGVTSQGVDVTVLGDALDEADETFFVDLSGASGATVVDGRGLGTILDDDGPGARDVGSDLDGDGRSDVVWRRAASGENAAWLMDGAAVLAGAALPGLASPWTLPGFGDLDGDRRADLVWRDPASGQNAVWFMSGAAVASAAYLPAVAGSWNVAAVGDFDGDRREDLLWQEAGSGALAVWLMNGPSVATAALLPTVASGWQVVAAGDVDGDGRADVVWFHAATGTAAVWLMNGPAVASAAALPAVPTTWAPSGLGDLDGDGRADLLWHEGATGANAAWLLAGAGIASAASLPSTAPAWSVAGVGDLDGDGKADVLWREGTTGQDAVWKMDGTAVVSGQLTAAVPDTAWTVQAP